MLGTMTEMDNVTLAKQHLSYGPGQDEATDREMWRRFPYLAGWFVAARKVSSAYLDRWEEETGEEWGPADGPMPTLPEYKVLMAAYADMVRRIADGAPGPGVDD